MLSTAQGLRFRLPQFPELRPPKYRPDNGAVELRCQNWIRAHLRGIYDSDTELEEFVEQRTTLWTLLAYATARADRIEHICNWINLLFALDDVYLTAGPERAELEGFEHFSAVIDGMETGVDSVSIRALGTLRDRTREQMPARLWTRLADSLRSFFDACLEERRTQLAGVTPDSAAYFHTRGRSIGICCFPLAEYGIGADLTEELRESADLRDVRTLATHNLLHVNDIFSYRTEFFAGDTMNGVRLVQERTGKDLQEAVAEIAGEGSAAAAGFHDAASRIASGSHEEDVHAYLDALKCMMAGNLEWSYITSRYHGPGHVWTGRTDGDVILTPTRTVFVDTEWAS